MKKSIILRVSRQLILLLSLYSSAPFAQTNELVIGRVIITTGSVQALSADGDIRELSRRSEIFSHDTIITGAEGSAQIRLVDEAIFVFRADTEFSFDEYRYDGPGGNGDTSIMSMIRGGFRAIDGRIGESEGDEYRINTPFASIGIRGTTHEAVIDPASNSLFTAVYDGGTTISNNAGSVDLGIGAEFDFSQTRAGQAPVGLNVLPPLLGGPEFLPANNQNGMTLLTQIMVIIVVIMALEIAMMVPLSLLAMVAPLQIVQKP